MDTANLIKIFEKASLCRKFEERVYKEIQNNRFSYPIYLSAGQEFIPAALAHFLQSERHSPLIFAQHRAHSTFLSFGGRPTDLIDKLLFSREGSASIQCKEIKMYGHDGLMGSQIPIAVGACFSTRRLTLAIMGDASAEEDYVMSAIAWAGTHQLPIIFVVEDNNFSILTEKSVRRNWSMSDFSTSVNVKGYDINDDPSNIITSIHENWVYGHGLMRPILLNIHTHRLFWHAGAGQDDYYKFDTYQVIKELLGDAGDMIDSITNRYINDLWDRALEKQLKS